MPDQLKNDIVSLPFISAYTFRFYSNHGWLTPAPNDKYISQLPNGIHPKNVQKGDIIYISTDLIERFFTEIDPIISNPYILISGRTDRGVNDKISTHLSEKIIQWFTHNNISDHPKISTIPMGFQNKHWRMDDHPQNETNVLKVRNENIEVQKDILLSFRIKTNAYDRQPCFDYFQQYKKLVTFRQNFEEYRTDDDFVMEFFREVRRHKFVVCPFGNAFDCHRNWETFALGGIPIIKKHKSMEAFYDMPAWFVDDWSDVTEYSMNKTYDFMRSNWQSYNHEKIYFDYWHKQILSYQNQ